MTLSHVAKLLAALCAALFAGAALYIALVEQPARLLASMDVALGEFRPGFPRARAMQASLAIAGTVCALLAWWRGAGRAWLLVAALLASIVAFTIVVVGPVYEALLDPALAPSAPAARALLEHWGRLHLVRVALSLAALVLCLEGLAGARRAT